MLPKKMLTPLQSHVKSDESANQNRVFYGTVFIIVISFIRFRKQTYTPSHDRNTKQQWRLHFEPYFMWKSCLAITVVAD